MSLGNIINTVGDWVTGRDRNKEQRAVERDQQRELDDQANKVYEHEKKIFKANKNNYLAERDYAFDTAVTNWEYGKTIQDFSYSKDLASYLKSEDIYDATRASNQVGAKLARSDELTAIQDLELSHAFQREAMHADLSNEIKSGGIQKLEQGVKLSGIQNNRRASVGSIQQQLNTLTTKTTFDKEAKLIEGLQKSGRASLGQAGVSRKKTLQSTAADTFRSLVELDSTLSGARNKANIDLLKVMVDSSLNEQQVGLNLETIELGINKAREEVKYNNRVLNANMDSAVMQMERNLQKISLQKMNADLQAEANLNIFPERFDYAPEPVITPERKFIKPMKREAATVPKGPRVATGLDSVFGVVDDVANVIGQVTGLGKLGDMFGGQNNVLGSLTGNTFGNAANSGVSIGDLTGGGSFPTIGSVTGNNIGNFGGGTPFDFSNLPKDYSF